MSKYKILPQYLYKIKISRAFIISFAISFLLLNSVYGATKNLTSTIDRLLNNPVLAHGIQGVSIKSPTDGSIIYEKNSDVMLIPASNLKLITSAAALEILGAAHRMKTSIWITGEINKNGTLIGDIIIKGGGDPVFTSEKLAVFANELQKRGIKTVNGDIKTDDTIFNNTRLGIGWAWDYETYSYAAQISGLNTDGNSLKVWVYPASKIGSKAIIKTIPATKYITISNKCVTTAKKSTKKISIQRIHGRNEIKIEGSIPIDNNPAKEEETVSIDDPAIFTGTLFKEILGKKGIRISGKIKRGVLPNNAELITELQSPDIAELLLMMNKPSNNLIAECLLKTMGVKQSGKGTASDGLATEQEFLKQIGADISCVNLTDGSGLSRTNFITAANISKVLEYMYNHKYAKIYIDSLPIAGVDGTLKSKMKDTAAQGITKAKSGYLNSVSTISGYTMTKSGKPVIFSIIMNNHQCTNSEATTIQDAIINEIANSD